jgi:hypothetical protein
MKQLRKRPPLYQIVSCFVCALPLGFLLWQRTLRSNAVATPTDHFFLFVYIGLTLAVYLGSLLLVNRFCNLSSIEAIPSLTFVSLMGTSLPFVVNSVHVWSRMYRVELGWFIPDAFETLGLFNVLMAALMACSCGLGLLLTKSFAAIVRLCRGAKTVRT